ncbi:unnamed protein product, partial [Heterosigma akashiwo]
MSSLMFSGITSQSIDFDAKDSQDNHILVPAIPNEDFTCQGAQQPKGLKFCALVDWSAARNSFKN